MTHPVRCGLVAVAVMGPSSFCNNPGARQDNLVRTFTWVTDDGLDECEAAAIRAAHASTHVDFAGSQEVLPVRRMAGTQGRRRCVLWR
jgi:hypothetical protein